MAQIPKRPITSQPYRAVLNKLEKVVPFPKVNPSVYTVAGLSLSILYLYLDTPIQKAICLAVILVGDWFDGATARKYNLTSRGGYMIDVVFDRISEGLMFAKEIATTIGFIFYLLWLLNCGISFYGVKTGKHRLIAVRFAWLLVLIFQAI